MAAAHALRDCLTHAQGDGAGCRWALPLRNHDDALARGWYLVPDAGGARPSFNGFPDARDHC